MSRHGLEQAWMAFRQSYPQGLKAIRSESPFAEVLARQDELRHRESALLALEQLSQLTPGDTSEKLRYGWCIARSLRELGQNQFAIGLFDRLLMEASRLTMPLEVAYAEEGLAWCFVRTRRYEEAEVLQASALRYFLQEGLVFERMHRLTEFSIICLLQGRLDEAEKYGREACTLARRSSDPIDDLYCRGNLALVYEARKEFRFANSIFRSLTNSIRAHEHPYFFSEWKLGLGRTRVALGDLEGLNDLEVAQDLAEDHAIHHRVVEALEARATVSHQVGKLDEASHLKSQMQQVQKRFIPDIESEPVPPEILPDPRRNPEDMEIARLSEWIKEGLENQSPVLQD